MRERLPRRRTAWLDTGCAAREHIVRRRREMRDAEISELVKFNRGDRT